jgi:hypothetical protein
LPVPSALTVPSSPIDGPNGTAVGSPHASRIGIWNVPSGLAATLTVAESSSLSDTRRSFVDDGGCDRGGHAEAAEPVGSRAPVDVRDARTRNCITAPVVCGSAGG